MLLQSNWPDVKVFNEQHKGTFWNPTTKFESSIKFLFTLVRLFYIKPAGRPYPNMTHQNAQKAANTTKQYGYTMVLYHMSLKCGVLPRALCSIFSLFSRGWSLGHSLSCDPATGSSPSFSFLQNCALAPRLFCRIYLQTLARWHRHLSLCSFAPVIITMHALQISIARRLTRCYLSLLKKKKKTHAFFISNINDVLLLFFLYLRLLGSISL